MRKLTKREKVLLYGLLIVAAIAAGWFLIRPALDASDAADVALTEATMQESSIEQKIAARSTYAESIDESRARIEELKKAFLRTMTSDDLDRYVTGLMQKNGLIAESLLISVSADPAASLAITKLNVKVTATGELEQLISLVEQVSGLQGIRIATLSVHENGEKTKLVPMTPEEIETAKATPAPKKTDKKKTEKKTIPDNMKEVSIMEYGVNLEFEVMEFDEALFAAMGG